MCLGSGFGFTPAILPGVWGVCFSVHSMASGRECWLRCGVSFFVCVLCLYPANPASGLWRVCSNAAVGFNPPILARLWGVCVYVWVQPVPPNAGWGLGCVCWGVCLAFSLPFLAGICSVYVGVRVVHSSRRSWLGCGALQFVCEFWLSPASPGCSLWCVCLGTRFGFIPPIPAWVLGCVYLCARSEGTPSVLAL